MPSGSYGGALWLFPLIQLLDRRSSPTLAVSIQLALKAISQKKPFDCQRQNNALAIWLSRIRFRETNKAVLSTIMK